MEFYEHHDWRGFVVVTVRYHDDPSDPRDLGRVIDQYEGENLIVDAGRNMVADTLNGAFAYSPKLQYTELGSDNGTILALVGGNTALGAGIFRKAMSTYVTRSVTGQNITQAYIAPNEACSTGGTGTNFTINEIGWFAGNASGTVGSGTLVARITSYSRAKNQNESILIQRTDQF